MAFVVDACCLRLPFKKKVHHTAIKKDFICFCMVMSAHKKSIRATYERVASCLLAC